jgi:hypothetical protein
MRVEAGIDPGAALDMRRIQISDIRLARDISC